MANEWLMAEYQSRKTGKRKAALISLRMSAADDHEYEAAARDLDEHGWAVLRDGKRVDPASVRNGSKITYMEYDEEEG